MVDAMELVLLAAGVLGLLGIFLLFQRIGLAAKRRSNAKGVVEKLLKRDDAKREAIERRFRNVFFTSADRGEGLIEYYMTRHKCGRTEAMQLAMEERERDERRYD